MRLDRCSRLDIKRRRPSGSAFFFARILAGQPADTVITDKACDAQEWLADPFRLKNLPLEVKSRFKSLEDQESQFKALLSWLSCPRCPADLSGWRS